MKPTYQPSSREPPPGEHRFGIQIYKQTLKTYITLSEKTDMKKERAKYKQQDDRVLKRLSREERRTQERLRRAIASDPLFAAV